MDHLVTRHSWKALLCRTGSVAGIADCLRAPAPLPPMHPTFPPRFLVVLEVISILCVVQCAMLTSYFVLAVPAVVMLAIAVVRPVSTLA